MASNSKKVICENGCAKATRVAKKFDPFRSTPKSIVTIDFGTTHCSVSSLLDVNACPDPSVLDPVLLNLDTKCRKRVPSCILFDKFGDRKGIGYEAREEYATLGMRVRPAYAFFEHVKKEIQRKEVSQFLAFIIIVKFMFCHFCAYKHALLIVMYQHCNTLYFRMLIETTRSKL